MKNIDFKKILLIALGLIILFIPTYVAIANYNSHKPENIVDDVTTVIISDPEGRTYTLTSDNDTTGVISMFNDINQSGTPASALPDSLVGSGFLLVTYSSSDSEFSYKYYFTIDSSECYFADPNGKIYKIGIQQAKAFLGSSYSVYLYKTATPPVLTASDTNVISASELKWFYLVSGGTYQQFEYVPQGNDVLTYDVGNNFSFNFNIEPSYANVKVYKNEELMYDDSISNLDALRKLEIKRHTMLNFVITASWDQEADSEYYGSATYSFNCMIQAPAEFKIGESEIEHGDILVLSGVNVNNPADIQVTFEPALANNFTPVFFTDGELVHALVPFSYDVESGQYKITISYGVTQQSFELNVIKARYDFDRAPTNHKADSSLISLYYSEEDVVDYEKLYAEICKSSEPLKYFSGAFIDYQTPGALTSKGAKLMLGFSREQILADGRTFKHDGIDFEAKAGIEVPAMSSGKVVYKGACDVLGNFVVVDHGYGLKTWYAHLSEISVSVGDIVTTSQTLGKTGNTGFTLENRIHVEFTVFDVPVAPFSLWDEGLIVSNFD